MDIMLPSEMVKLIRFVVCLIFIITIMFVDCSVLFAISSNEEVFISATKSVLSQSIALHENYEYIRPIGTQTAIGFIGQISDIERLYSVLCQDCTAYELENTGKGMSTKAIALRSKQLIGHALRTDPYRLQVIVCGCDNISDSCEIYWLDEVGSLKKVPYAAHGEELPIVLSILDLNLRYKITSDNNSMNDDKKVEGLQLVTKCWNNVRKRTKGRIGHITIKSISKRGFTNHGTLD